MDVDRLVQKWLRLEPEDRERVEQLVDRWLAEGATISGCVLQPDTKPASDDQ